MTHFESDFPHLGRMLPVTLEKLKSVSLMNRIDTKFVTDISLLEDILREAYSSGYKICEISGSRLLRYTSVYYDTESLDMFRVHRNGKKTRQKIRVRTYHINGQTYLEIKNKRNTGRTKKKRMAISPGHVMDLIRESSAGSFISEHSRYDIEDISPETSTDFQRITLTDKDLTERITIDIDLNFINHRNGISANIGDLVIFEVKQDGRNRSAMKEIFLKHRVFPFRISKYCLSVVLTESDIHPGRYKKKLRYIHKTLNRHENITD